THLASARLLYVVSPAFTFLAGLGVFGAVVFLATVFLAAVFLAAVFLGAAVFPLFSFFAILLSLGAKVSILYHRLGLQIIRVEETDSTNTMARQMADESAIGSGTVIVAGRQRQGRGQGNTTWDSEPGQNLTFTIVLHPFSFKADDHLKLNTAVAL